MLCGDAHSGFSFVQVTLEHSEVEKLVAERDAAYSSPKRMQLEERGRALLHTHTWTPAEVNPFVEDVFSWGKGTRNIGRVLECSDLSTILRDCSRKIGDGKGAPAAAAGAVWLLASRVPQLGPSFASKLLRFLHPDDVVIFDSVIRLRLGLDETEKAYAFFHAACRTIQTAFTEKDTKLALSDIEAAIFMKLRKNQI